MSNQTRFRFFLATPTQEYSSQTLRKYLYSAKSSQELASAKKYLASYFARSDIGVYKWFPKNQVFKHYPRKVAEESFIPSSRSEALLRVRKGLSDLAEGLENLDKQVSFILLFLARTLTEV